MTDPSEIRTFLPRCERTGKPILEISHSGLNTLGSCPRKWAFRKAVVQFNEARDSGIAADVGSAMHEGVQEYMRTGNTDTALEALALHHPIELPDNTKHHEYSLEASTISLLHTIEHGGLDEYELATFIKDGREVPATEIGFLVEIEMDYVMIHLRGFIDLVLLRRIDNAFMAVDIKTMTTHSAANLETKYRFDWQCTSYGIPLQGLLGVEGKFHVAIMGIIQSDRDPEVVMQPYVRTQHDVDEYYYYLLDKCAQIQRYWIAQRFPRDPKSCISFGRTCFFYQHCDVSTLQEMQNLINPSGRAGAPPRPFTPVFTAQLEYSS